MHSLALEIAKDSARSAEALAVLRRDKFAESSQGPRDAVWKTWCSIHHSISPSEPPLPLTPLKVEKVSSILKAAGYLSIRNYIQRAKSEHIACEPSLRN